MERSSEKQHRSTPLTPADDGAPLCASCGAHLARNNLPPPLRLISFERMRVKVDLGATAARELVAKGLLPPPIKFGTNRRSAVRWLEHEVDDAILALAARRPQIALQRATTSASKITRTDTADTTDSSGSYLSRGPPR